MSANWSLPGTGNLYTDTLTALKDRDADLAVGFDPAYTTPTNLPTNTVRWTSAAKRWEKWNGTAWSVLSSGYAINITGTAANITGVAAAANGGTGQSSYTIGDLLYASGATTLSKIADIATGNVLLSGGVGAAPSYGKVGLTTHVSGTLPVANGGTGVATLSGVAFGNGTGAFTAATAAQLVAVIGTTAVQVASTANAIADGSVSTAAKLGNNIVGVTKLAREGTAGHILYSAGAGADPYYAAPPSSGVTSVNGNTGAVTAAQIAAAATSGYGYTPANPASVAGINSNFDWVQVHSATIASNGTLAVRANYGDGVYRFTNSAGNGCFITSGGSVSFSIVGGANAIYGDIISNSGYGSSTLTVYKLRKLA